MLKKCSMWFFREVLIASTVLMCVTSAVEQRCSVSGQKIQHGRASAIYYVCRFGIKVKKLCPFGEYFSPILNSCHHVSDLETNNEIQAPKAYKMLRFKTTSSTAEPSDGTAGELLHAMVKFHGEPETDALASSPAWDTNLMDLNWEESSTQDAVKYSDSEKRESPSSYEFDTYLDEGLRMQYP